jgi:hypothetical protein
MRDFIASLLVNNAKFMARRQLEEEYLEAPYPNPLLLRTMVKAPCCSAKAFPGLGGPKLDDLANLNSTLCQCFCQQWKTDGKLNTWPNWQSFHKPLITAARIAKIWVNLEDLMGELEGLPTALKPFIKNQRLTVDRILG